MAAELFGPDKPPLAIILTHGHFDHRGALDELLQVWDVPVYAHYLEMPYLTGRSSYPPPDPTVGGGLMSYFSFLFPNSPINIRGKIQALDERNTNLLPFLPGWQFIATPGHAPGHISLFMEKHGILIAGDAFVTTKQESLAAVVSQKRIISGPPKYFTYDWNASKTSVEKLMALKPQVAATGHGKPVRGLKLAAGLKKLVTEFDKIAIPSHGRYVRKSPWINEKGVQYLPPAKFNLTGVIVALALTAATIYFTNKKSSIFNKLSV
jgi:glyoxylase-like metal-dependent hydrolase (beta-lactamase superfamily II)